MNSDTNFLAVGVCVAVISLTLWVTFAASRRSRSADGFFAAGRSITGGRTDSRSRANSFRPAASSEPPG